MNPSLGLSPADLHTLSPSPSVRRFGEDMVRSASDRPILDVACGCGRNGALIAHLGADVIGLDIDLQRLRAKQLLPGNATLRQAFNRIKQLELDLVRQEWPFVKHSVGGIMNIHFLHPPLLERFCESLIPGGLLIFETVIGVTELPRLIEIVGLKSRSF